MELLRIKKTGWKFEVFAFLDKVFWVDNTIQ